ncbi:TPA: Fe-S cluster assembly ATPase SufC [Candidatus Acetothermia bacterium]|nr:Fe-S cluster assembly ATPase SufC [Candidatus Acetothermia bacterium]
MKALEAENLHVSVAGRLILKGVDLALEKGKVHALMGPNGSGKSTLAFALAGHPEYPIHQGRILLSGEEITHLPPDQRAKRGLFLAFQYPPEVEGVRLRELMRLACGDQGQGFCDFMERYPQAVRRLHMEDLAERELNVGFSGGEKKRSELLQAWLLRPKVALLDEPDSGVDVDGVRVIADTIRELADSGTAVLVITHYPRVLEYVPPARVFVLEEGRISQEGGPELARAIEKKGFKVVKG